MRSVGDGRYGLRRQIRGDELQGRGDPGGSRLGPDHDHREARALVHLMIVEALSGGISRTIARASALEARVSGDLRSQF